jgi:NTP pyrophosphatase (non-canonical NTP hydrolase)
MTHAELVSALAKPGSDIVREMTPLGAHQMHMAIGICGEAGELIDAVKKHTIYNQPIDVDNVIEELGDLEFYMEGLRQGMGITREECLKHNIDKLTIRYGKKYSDAAAKQRKDKMS